MLTVSPNFLSSTLGIWDYNPINVLGNSEQHTLDDIIITSNIANLQPCQPFEIVDHDCCHLPSFPSSCQVPPDNRDFDAQNQNQNQNQNRDYYQIKRSESDPQISASSNEQLMGGSALAKRLNHNASERDRRKKINALYASLRALLPAPHQTKDLSIPATVTRVLNYIPQLQKELENLAHKKDQLVSKVSLLQGVEEEFFQEEKPKKDLNINNTTKSMLYSICVNKLGDKEIVVQISTYEKIPLPEVLMLLEKEGLLVIDVSSFQTFGERAFHNIHLSMEGTVIRKCEILKEELLSLIEKHKEMYQ